MSVHRTFVGAAHRPKMIDLTDPSSSNYVLNVYLYCMVQIYFSSTCLARQSLLSTLSSYYGNDFSLFVFPTNRVVLSAFSSFISKFTFSFYDSFHLNPQWHHCVSPHYSPPVLWDSLQMKMRPMKTLLLESLQARRVSIK